jgi:hypothetical protein
MVSVKSGIEFFSGNTNKGGQIKTCPPQNANTFLAFKYARMA